MDLSGVTWRKSSYTGSNGGNCVEVAELTDVAAGSEQKIAHTELIAIRDSKNPDGPKLFFNPAEWDAFLNGVKASEFHRG
jgi:hypothetical protein